MTVHTFMGRDSMETHRTTVKIPKELHRQVRLQAFLKDMTFTDAMEEALREWLKKHQAPEQAE